MGAWSALAAAHPCSLSRGAVRLRGLEGPFRSRGKCQRGAVLIPGKHQRGAMPVPGKHQRGVFGPRFIIFLSEMTYLVSLAAN